MRILAAMDKFKGTLSAAAAAEAVCMASEDHNCDPCPVGDGGDGTIDAFGGSNRTSLVMGPHGELVRAGWRLADRTAFIEMAAASGLVVGEGRHDPVAATTYGTGQLIAEAIRLGAERILIGVGGSATTDGGAGATEAIGSVLEGGRLPVPVTVLCDVTTIFTDAARVYGPQKGATPNQIVTLSDRLRSQREAWLDHFDVDELAGSGAAGGLAGALAVLGAELKPGFAMVAGHLRLAQRVAAADLVFTGEGRFDETSRRGKAVGGVLDLAERAGVPAIVIAGSSSEVGPAVVSLVARFGDRSWTDPAGCIGAATRELLGGSASTER